MTKNRLNEYVDLSPVDFLKVKIGRDVNLTELLLLDYIVDTYKFEKGVTNLFIEQVLRLNNNKFTRGFTLKVANEWEEQAFSTIATAISYADKEYEQFLQFQRRDSFGEIRELTSKEKEVVNRIFYKNDLDKEILDLVISYCMKINDGYIITWFINRVIEYLKNHHVANLDDAKELIHVFHQRFVISFGITNEKSSDLIKK